MTVVSSDQMSSDHVSGNQVSSAAAAAGAATGAGAAAGSGTAGAPGAAGTATGGPTIGERPARWRRVCRLADVVPDRGVAALVDGQQVAVFVLRGPGAGPDGPGPDGDGGAGSPPEVYAVGNRDPYSGANVMARGLVGSAGDRPTVASPIYKQRFDLRDGSCLDGEEHLPAWPARAVDGWIELGAPASAPRPDRS